MISCSVSSAQQRLTYHPSRIVFLAALDQTIAAVALPTIVRDIGGESGYSWVGTAYLLSKYSYDTSVSTPSHRSLLVAACLSPLYGKLAVIIGRKPVLFFAIGIFLFGSAMCGAAQSFIWLALCTCIYKILMVLLRSHAWLYAGRGVQGIGGGGIIQMVMVTISDISKFYS